MNKHLKIFLFLLVLGGLVIFAIKAIAPYWEESNQRKTSDALATKGVIRIGVDNWIGYFPLCSPEMRRNLRSRDYALECIEDAADYTERFKKLSDGDLDLAVGTVDAYLLNGGRFDFPGVIISVIDESKGGDAIIANAARASSLDALSGGKLRIAYTPASPSEHLLKSLNAHFDLGLYDNNRSWRMPSDGSSEALKSLLAGKADAAVLWEPDVTRALSKGGMVKLVGTEDTDKLIVDILLAGREFASRRPGAVRELLDAYFETLQVYQADNERLIGDIHKETDLGRDRIASMLGGVQWSGLLENGTLWFDVQQQKRIGSDGLVEAIEAAAEILVDNGDFGSTPVPGSDPYRLTSRDFVKQLYLETYPGGADMSQENSLSRDFKSLTEEQWRQMRRVGTLKVEPVSFRRGTGLLDLDGKNTIDRIAEKIRRYPNFRILVEGHTGLKGDQEQNLKLSASRAQAVARYLMVTYKVDSDRVRALGYGSSKPLAKKPGESNRAYSYRLPRVEISLLSGGR